MAIGLLFAFRGGDHTFAFNNSSTIGTKNASSVFPARIFHCFILMLTRQSQAG
jgi:hypothetical protein